MRELCSRQEQQRIEEEEAAKIKKLRVEQVSAWTSVIGIPSIWTITINMRAPLYCGHFKCCMLHSTNLP